MQLKTAPKSKRRIFIGLLLLAVVVFAAPRMKRATYELFLAGDMYHAIKVGDAPAVQKLLQKGANPNRDGSGGLMGGTPLMWATSPETGGTNTKIMKVLIKGGADVNQKTNGGVTALMQAYTPESAQVLLEAGADPNLKDDDGEDALQFAKRRNLWRVVEVIERAQTKQ